jgi:acyl-CoA reductase-like NAD-dependent aldehyde dehydrogenase
MPSPPEPEAGTTLDFLEPATAAVLASVPRAGVKDVDAAVARARAAYPSWRAVAPGDRAAVLRHVFAYYAGAPERLLSALRFAELALEVKSIFYATS